MAPATLEPQPPSLARQHYRGAIAARRKTLRVLRFFALLSFVALVVVGWYIGRRGFGRQTRYRIAEELRKRGVDATIGRLTLDPFRGLIAQDVRIFDPANQNVLAAISQISLDINYAALLHHQAFLNALDVRDARLTIPLPPTPNMPAKARIGNLRAHVYFPPDQIYVSEAEGNIGGVRVSVSGQLIKPADYQPPPDSSDEERLRHMRLVQRVVDEIERCQFPGQAANVQVKFSANLAHLDAARATVTLTAERVARSNYELRNVTVNAEWADQVLNIRRCEGSDAGGAFAAHATWNAAQSSAEFQAHSTLALKPFLQACGFGNLVSDLTFTAPPVLELSGEARLGGSTPEVSVIGRANAIDVSYKSVSIASLTTEFAWDGTRTMLRDLRARFAPTGEISVDALNAPNDFRLKLESDVNPANLRAMAPPEIGKILGEWEWQRAPRFRLSVHGTSPSPADWSGDGSIEFERARFRNVPLNSASAQLHFRNRSVTFDNLRIARDEGAGSGTVTYDFARHEVRLTNVKTTLRPTDIIVWIEPRYYKHVAPYKFHHVPTISANGVMQFQGGTGDHLELLVDAPTGMDYVFLGKTLSFDRTSGRLLFTYQRLQISDLAGTLFEGTVRGGADISLGRGDPHYRATLNIDGVDFPRLTDLYFKYKTAHGRLAGSFDWTGAGDDARTIDGFGKLRVSEGNVFAIPIFGPLSSLLGAIIPGAGYSVAHQATADFTMKSGAIHTDNFKVAGKLFSMIGHGDIYSLDDKLDFNIKVSGGGAGALLTPVYNLFEYKGEGSIKDPKWHPKNF